MSIERHTHTPEFDQKPTVTERKFLPLFPETLERYRQESRPIKQSYLSHPEEPFTLHFREKLGTDGALHYHAYMKDVGTLTEDGITRLEVSAPIDERLYRYYESEGAPTIYKLRAEPRPGIAIDFHEDGTVQVESKDEAAWQDFTAEHGEHFVDTTGDSSSTNEWKAHLAFRQQNEGRETLQPLPELRADDIVNDILRQDNRSRVVHIGGRSGSGKSTIVREVREKLERVGYRSVVMSTDDYHRGTSKLREYNGGEVWTHWDDAIVYDTQTMAADLATLASGGAIYRREIDWSIAEPVFTGVIEPADIVIVEGIYAKSPDIVQSGSLVYEMPTPLATCIGRRLMRDMRERPEFADPAKNLGYMLQEAEPAYRAQQNGESGQ